MGKEIERSIDLSELPRWGKHGKAKEGTINWNESIGKEISFVYEQIKGKLKIVEYVSSRSPVVINYKGRLFEINKNDLLNCKLGRILHETREVVCSGKGAIEHFNDIPTTAPWMVKYFQGGYDEAKLYTYQSNKKIKPICPDCGKVSDILVPVCNIYNQGYSCVCNDGISIGHKIIYSILCQNKIKFKSNKGYRWCEFYNKYKDKYQKGEYDFVLDGYKIIIEVDGGFHRTDNLMNGTSMEESMFIDSEKDRLAKENGYNVIRLVYNHNHINEYISEIVSSELCKILKLDDNTINIALEFSGTNISKMIATYWNSKEEWETTQSLASKFKLDRMTITKYLKHWTKVGYCNYDSKYESDKRYEITKQRNMLRDSKRVEVFKDDKSLGMFFSISELGRNSKEVLGVQLQNANIIKVLKGTRKHHKGYGFRYASKEEYEEYLNSQSMEKVV